MNYNDIKEIILQESMLLVESRSTLYHLTSLDGLKKIIQNDTIRLSYADRLGSDKDYSKWEKYPYYLSTARTKQSNYIKRSSYPILHLDGYKLQSRYPIIPYFYGKTTPKHISDESEERLVSKEPIIEDFHQYIKSIEIVVYDDITVEDMDMIKSYCDKYGIGFKANAKPRSTSRYPRSEPYDGNIYSIQQKKRFYALFYLFLANDKEEYLSKLNKKIDLYNKQIKNKSLINPDEVESLFYSSLRNIENNVTYGGDSATLSNFMQDIREFYKKTNTKEEFYDAHKMNMILRKPKGELIDLFIQVRDKVYSGE